MSGLLQTHDLARLAESLADAYRPQPLAGLPGLNISLLVAEGHASWFRQVSHEELLLVLEGVVTLNGPAGKVVLNEGELATAERNARHHVQSGMRSTVLLFEEVKAVEAANGHQAPDTGLAGQLDKRNAAVAVLTSAAFTWLRAGTAGAYAAHASRLLGQSEPYVVPAGSLVAVVYRGVLDFDADGEPGTLVGSQMLVAPPGTRLGLRSARGATVLLLARQGSSLPRPAAPTPTATDGTRGDP